VCLKQFNLFHDHRWSAVQAYAEVWLSCMAAPMELTSLLTYWWR